MSEKTPNWYIDEDVSYTSNSSEVKVLKAGSFVRPIEYQYLPAHVKNDERWRWQYRKDNDVFCYTSAGIIPVPKKILKIAE